jgi:hypothetical protein
MKHLPLEPSKHPDPIRQLQASQWVDPFLVGSTAGYSFYDLTYVIFSTLSHASRLCQLLKASSHGASLQGSEHALRDGVLGIRAS